jgi:hypothetical protein
VIFQARVRGILQICRERELINRVQTPPTLLPILKKKKYNNSKKKKKEKRNTFINNNNSTHNSLSWGSTFLFCCATETQRARDLGG